MQKKTAVVCFNLGGPDSLEAVRPFLFNLFNDKAIISVPNPMRYVLAKLISKKRAPIAQKIYGHIGNQSPILKLTHEQTSALDVALNQDGEGEYRSFIAMRYWHPMTQQVVADVKAWQPDQIILLPLYPQYSTTTSGSSFEAWHKEARKQSLAVETKTICCYPLEASFIQAHVQVLKAALDPMAGEDYRVLFSAHGLPEKIIASGDPYQWQVEQTVAAVVKELEVQMGKSIDHVVCYQSRVGPLKWIGPSTEDEIKRAGQDKKSLVITPIAFVSEHSETLVELDIEYREFAEKQGVEHYVRVPALAAHPGYIAALKGTVKRLEASPDSCSKGICPAQFGRSFCAKK